MSRRMGSSSYCSGAALVEGEADAPYLRMPLLRMPLISEYRFSESGADAPRYDDVVMGYGRCEVWGCPCRKYEEVYGSDLCNNCGHSTEITAGGHEPSPLKVAVCVC